MNDVLSWDPTPFTKTLRDTASQQVDENLRFALRGAADTIDRCIDAMMVQRNETALRDLNGVWAYAVRLHMLATEGPQETPPQTAQLKAA